MFLSVSFNFLYFPQISHAFPVSTVHPTQTRKTRFTYRAAFLSFDKTQPLQKNSHNTNPQKKHIFTNDALYPPNALQLGGVKMCKWTN